MVPAGKRFMTCEMDIPSAAPDTGGSSSLDEPRKIEDVLASVADGEADPFARQREGVIPVAADLVREVGGPVRGADLDAGVDAVFTDDPATGRDAVDAFIRQREPAQPASTALIAPTASTTR